MLDCIDKSNDSGMGFRLTYVRHMDGRFRLQVYSRDYEDRKNNLRIGYFTAEDTLALLDAIREGKKLECSTIKDGFYYFLAVIPTENGPRFRVRVSEYRPNHKTKSNGVMYSVDDSECLLTAIRTPPDTKCDSCMFFDIEDEQKYCMREDDCHGYNNRLKYCNACNYYRPKGDEQCPK